jgi:O-antigen/teichoic acid export membrane protein
MIRQDEKSLVAANAERLGIARRSFSTHVAWTLLARLITAGSNVLAGVVIARTLGAEALGTYVSLNVVALTAVQLGSFGLPSAATYFVAQGARRFRSISFNALLFAFAMGVLLASALTAATYGDAPFLPQAPMNLLFLAALSVPFQLLTLVSLNILLGAGEVGRFSAFDALGQSLTLINAIAALLLARTGLFHFMALNLAASATITLIVLARIFRHPTFTEGQMVPDLALLSEMIRYGLKAHVTLVASFLIFRIDLLIVEHFRGAAEAGVYAVAAQFASLLMLLPSVIGTLLFPRIAAIGDEDAAMTCQVARRTSAIMAFICVATGALGLMLPALYGAAFAPAPYLLLILLPGVFLIGIESVLVQYFTGRGLPRAIPFFWIITLAINLALNFAFVPAFGAYAAAVVSTISYATIFALVALHLRSKTGQALSAMLVPRPSEINGILGMRWKGSKAH